MSNDLLNLKNLGNTSVHWLRSIGVQSIDDLKSKGAIEAYIEIKRRGIRVSKVLLYALHGALTNTQWTDIDNITKQQLLDKANKYDQQL